MAISGGSGNDSLVGSAGTDAISGNGGNDTLVGAAGNNALFGGAGNDLFTAGSGADSFDGGSGQDNIDYSASGAGVRVDLSAGTLTGGLASNDLLGGGIDGVIGSVHADSLTGFDGMSTAATDAYTNQFWGGGGNDTILGLGGNDQLYGGADQDLIFGGSEDDLVLGDAGQDSLNSGSGRDTLYGGTGADALDGGADNDHAEGGDGNDTLIGGAGVDSLYGGNDADVFLGPNGAGDLVDGGEGGVDNDTLDLSGLGAHRITYAAGNPENGRVEFLNTSGSVTGSMTFANIERIVPCFTPGSLIATARGELAVEDLVEGDRVITRDNGMQPLRWSGLRALTPAELRANPRFRPVMIRAGALGNGLPVFDMAVSPNHRMLLIDDRNALLFEEREVLVAAKHLVGRPGIGWGDVAQVTYLHLLFDRHEVVLANGAWTESFQPGDLALGGMAEAQRAEILALFPELALGNLRFDAARLSLKAHEARILFTPDHIR